MKSRFVKVTLCIILGTNTACVSNAITWPIKETGCMGVGCHSERVKENRNCESNITTGYLLGLPFDLGLAAAAGGAGGAVYGFFTISMALFSGFGVSGRVSNP